MHFVEGRSINISAPPLQFETRAVSFTNER